MSSKTEKPLPLYKDRLCGRFVAVELMDPDGSVDFWLVDLAGDIYCGCCCGECVPHEQLGPLPRKFKLAAGRLCGADTPLGDSVPQHRP